MSAALIVMRANPLHNGHKRLIDHALSHHDRVYIGLGTTQESRTEKNPLTYDERKALIEMIYDQGQVDIFPLKDYPEMTHREWQTYVLGELAKQPFFNEWPDAYYAGSEEDLEWWKSVTELENGPKEVSFIDRHASSIPSGTEIRKMIRQNKPCWKMFIPGEIVQKVENLFREIEDRKFQTMSRKEYCKKYLFDKMKKEEVIDVAGQDMDFESFYEWYETKIEKERIKHLPAPTIDILSVRLISDDTDIREFIGSDDIILLSHREPVVLMTTSKYEEAIKKN